MPGGLRCVVLSFIKIGPVVLVLCVVENRPSPLLWPLAYTTACTTVQAVIPTETRLIGASNALRVSKITFFLPIFCFYLGNDTRYVHSYYGM